ncbi:uncharacterized protein METZ01_LOCUS391452 [marine metagenome]|uniref:Uncharacterized protein n=1 Tax=marine metagenome TaxID=408172 RepID=A0A382UY32_9ZZZZ
MISRLMNGLSTKQKVMYLVMALVAVYIVWYVVDSLEGLDPDFQPGARGQLEAQNSPGNEMGFDPTKKTPEAVPSK